MNQLLEKFNECKSIVNYRIVYEFEDGNMIELVPKQTDNPALMGSDLKAKYVLFEAK